ncbi:MAG TPA: type I polyketide synthase, partial [Solirubrobacterales bacterium]|nr:type I polyketide synthase [Solirubrobacterales bacterium]
EGDGLTLTGRLSLSTHPWLAEHELGDTPLLPGAVFLELALQAAERVGARQVAELTLKEPLVIPERGAVAIQVSVGGADEDGGRRISIHSRIEAEGEEPEGAPAWTCHAAGRLSAEPLAAPESLGGWPPEGAAQLDPDRLYDGLGLEYGPALQGLSAAWRLGEDVLAEVSLAEEQRQEAVGYGIHPALLEVALASAGLLGEEERELEIPSSWGAVALEAAGAEELRVRLRAQGEGVSLELWDRAGDPLGQIGLQRTRSLDAREIGAKRRAETFFELGWTARPGSGGGEARPSSAERSERLAVLGELEIPGREHQRYGDHDALLASLGQGAEAPGAVLCELAPGSAADLPESAEEAARRVLALLQGWIAEERLEASRLVLLTPMAVAAGDGEAPELSTAPLWGLVRSAQLERPESFVLIDSDGSEASRAALPEALGSGEAQLALREGEILLPRVARAPAREAGAAARVLDPDRTVLLTGATSGLGALIARHLVERHGARQMLLVSRSGPEAEGAKELQAELEGLGAAVRIAACDVSQRQALKALLDSIPPERPLGAVIHAAGVNGFQPIAQLSPEEIERLFAAKARGAWHLHELTEHLDLSAFVLFSSISALIGGFGIGAYAAANSFLDALAQRRRAQGLPATSMSWALWAQSGGMTAGLGESDLRRMGRSGAGLLSDEQGLNLFDLTVEAEPALSLMIRPDPADLRTQASAGTLSPLFRGLVRVRPRRGVAAGSLATKLAALPQAEQEQAVLDLIRAEVALVLGHGSGEDVDPERAFQESGFTSIAAVELRNRLGGATGLRLSPTVIFDQPNPAALAVFILDELGASTASSPSDHAGGRTFLALLEGAQEQEKLPELRELIATASRFRATFASPSDPGAAPAPVTLAEGPGAPGLVLLTSVAATAGPQEFIGFAREFHGERAVRVAPHPGFAEGEPLPSALGVAAQAQAEAILRHAPADAPFVLAAYSSGCWIAHEVAACLERGGARLEGLVLLDPLFSLPKEPVWLDGLLAASLGQGDRALVPLDDARLTATMAYYAMLAEWRPQSLATPTAMIRADAVVAGITSRLDEGEAFWSSLPVSDVPGDHFTMMTDHLSDTAQAVKDFLRGCDERSNNPDPDKELGNNGA